MEEFDESVLDIVGLSAYEPRKLPRWLREELLTSWYRAEEGNADDESLVDNCIARWGFGPWLGGWGRAVIADEEVFLFESEALLEPVALADEIECGVQFVDPSPDCWDFTIVFTETRLQRRSACEGQPRKQGASACMPVGA